MNGVDLLIAGNNDGLITVWELVINEDDKAKLLLRITIDNCSNPYEKMATVWIES